MTKPTKQFEPFISDRLDGAAVKPDKEGIALFLVDQLQPDTVLPVILWRAAAQQVRDSIDQWLKESTRPGVTKPTTPRH